VKLTKLLFLFLVFAQLNISAQQTNDFLTINGRVIDNDNRRILPLVSVRLSGTNIATVTNADGEFLLKIPTEHANASVNFSHLGYYSQEISVENFGTAPRIIRLRPSAFALDEIDILRGNASAYIREVFNRIPQNYPQKAYQMVGFYRETIQKRNNFVAVTEAVLDIFKSPYNRLTSDQARIYIARRSSDASRIDTIFVRYQGGVDAALRLDIAKNYEDIFFDDFTQFYDFYFVGKTYLNDRPHNIVVFNQKRGMNYPLFRGRFYIDTETMAIARLEFSMNVDINNELATSIFVQRKPRGMRVQVTEASYLIQYTMQDGQWFYEYSRATVSFRTRWQRRLFSANYTLQSEMVVTDRTEEGVSRFSRRERLRSDAVIAEKVSDFEDDEFWGEYNIIEPEQSIEDAIRRISRRLQRRE